MKKLTRLLLVVLSAVILFGTIQGTTVQDTTVGAFSAPQMSFTDKLVKNPSGDGSSLVLYNPESLGTTTLFSGTGVTAQGTVEGKNVNFNIYGNDSALVNPTITTSRQEYYLMPNGTDKAFINTGIVPNENTTLEVSFMLPDGFNSMASGGAHPDIAGANASNNASMHFGGPLLLSDGKIQYLYGTWPGNSAILEAKDTSTGGGSGSFNWAPGQYYSKLAASPGIANVELRYNGDEKVYIGSHPDNISAHTFNSLYLFGQNNNGGLVNPVNVGIKEVKITKNGIVQRHFFAVPQSSTEFSSVPAPSNCMFDIITGTYFQNSGTGSFKTVEDISNANEVEIADAIGGLTGAKVTGITDAEKTKYTYKDEAGNYWAADYLEVNQEAGQEKVVLHKYSIASSIVSYTAALTYTPTTPSGNAAFNVVAIKLLDIKTTNTMTVLSNDSGLWMEGVIGPIIDYKIELGSASSSSGITIAADLKINIWDLDENISVSESAGSFYGAIWTATGAPRDFYTSTASGTIATIKAADVLFAPDKIVQQYAVKVTDSEYLIKIDVDFLNVNMSAITVNTDGIGVKINGILQSSAIVTESNPITIEGVFDSVLYEFDSFSVISGGYSNLVVSQSIVTITPTGSALEVEYTIAAKMYSVQILGKTTKNDEVFLENSIKNGYTEEICYDKDDAKTININSLVVENSYLIQGMIFGDTCLYVFDHFECNGRVVTGGLTIDSLILQGNQRVDGNFTIYAVYQKKYVINLGFEFGGNAASGNYDLSSASMNVFNSIPGINGYTINEGETAVIILKPDIRYSILSVSGDGGASQISKTDYPQLLVVLLDQSYDIVVSLTHRTIKVDYELDITDNNSRTIFGVPDYISGGTGANFTNISYNDLAQTLTENQDTLDMFNYRSIALMIYNFKDKRYELLTERFAGGALNAKDDDFFVYYVNPDTGESRVCLFVIQQYMVDLSTPGFTQSGTTGTTITFTNNDLGSYTVEFVGGEYTLLADGRYAVDFGTEIRLSKTVGKYGEFVHFTGLTEEENEAGSLVIGGDRYVGVNFESTKLAPWVMPILFSGLGIVIALIIMTILLVMRAKRLNREKLEKEAEIQDMKRKFNIADEISKLRNGEDIPQS